MTTHAAIYGTGRMAAAILEAAETLENYHIAAVAGPQEPAAETAVPWVATLEDLPARPDVLIDFTLPAGTLTAAQWCQSNAVPLVSGVTGLTQEARTALSAAAKVTPVLWSPNLSLGVNLLADLASRAAEVVEDESAIRIEDIHHQWKKDAPSGTALMLGQRIAEQRGGEDGAIEYHSVREGEVVGVHTIRFSLAGEELELVHRAYDRSIYAFGALQAGAWLITRPPGLYSARDWLASS